MQPQHRLFHARAPAALALLLLLLLYLPACRQAAGTAEHFVSTKPRIHVYNMSATRRNWTNTPPIKMYSLEITFPEMIKRSPYYEPDPSKADYYYAHMYMYHDHTTAAFEDQYLLRMAAAVDELRFMGPWFDRRPEAHIFPAVADRALCHVAWGPSFKNAKRFAKDSILLQHYGGSNNQVEMPSEWCDPERAWGGLCEPLLALADAAAEHLAENPPCYNKSRDLLVPTVEAENPGTTRFLNKTLDQIPQTKLAFFSGMLKSMFADARQPWGDAGYTGGVRQTIYKLYANDTRFNLPPTPEGGVRHMRNYYEMMAASTFCLAPKGLGWGSRVKTAVTRGCIPVIIQDGNKVEYEDVLPYQQFALRIPFAWVHQLPEILEVVVKRGWVPIMQRRLRCVWPLFWWGKPWGRAFEMAMCILRARQSGWPKPELDFGQCTMRCTPSEVAWKIHVPRRRVGEGAALALEAAGEGQESGLPGVVDWLPDGQAW